jgi:cysteine desulfurase / selenocysteine lyase
MMSPFDQREIERLRAETPGCHDRIHLNNAGAALMPQPVVEAVTGYLESEARLGGYEAFDAAEAELDRFYDAAARLIGTHREEVAFLENATRAWDLAFYGIEFAPGDRVLTSSVEYGSNFLAYLQLAHRRGVEIVVIPDDESGQIDVEALRVAVDERTRLIALTHVPTSGGLVNPAAAVGRVAREAGVLYLLDACQSAGQLPLDVAELGCDFLSTTGRKFLRGPRGTGFLYVRREVLERFEPPSIDVRGADWLARDRYELKADGRRFETWEQNFAGKLGLTVAIDYALALDIERIWARIERLAAGLRARLEKIDGVTVHDRGPIRCGIVTFTVSGHAPDVVRASLGEARINVWVSESDDTRVDFEARGLERLVRASVHYYNTEDEIDRCCAALGALARA